MPVPEARQPHAGVFGYGLPSHAEEHGRGADLDAKDARGNTPVDSALGKAGGNSRGGARIDVHEDTAALLGKLMTQAAAKK